MSGYALIYRTLLDHPVFRTDAEAMAFAWMVLRASWKPRTNRYKGHIIELERGQFAMSLRDIGGRLEWSKDRVYRFLNTLTKHAMIATSARQGAMVITVLNYGKYQALGAICEIEPETPPATAPRQHRDSTATQSNKGKKGKKGKEEENPPTPFTAPQPEWSQFVDYRKSIGKKLTPHAVKLNLAALEKLAAQGHDPRAVLLQSIERGWTGLFGIKEDYRGTGSNEHPGGKTGAAVASLLSDMDGEGPGGTPEALAQRDLLAGTGDGGSDRLALPGPSGHNP